MYRYAIIADNRIYLAETANLVELGTSQHMRAFGCVRAALALDGMYDDKTTRRFGPYVCRPERGLFVPDLSIMGHCIIEQLDSGEPDHATSTQDR